VHHILISSIKALHNIIYRKVLHFLKIQPHLRTTKSSQIVSLPWEVIFGFIFMEIIFGALHARAVGGRV